MKRTDECRTLRAENYQSSVSLIGDDQDFLPGTEVLGYCHWSASRTEQRSSCQLK